MRLLPKKGIFDSGRVLFLPVDSILPNPDQPRTLFSQPELEELADSIQSMGILQPLTVRRREGGWELVAGERRLRAGQASRSAGSALPIHPDRRSVLLPAGPGGESPAA